MDGHEDLDILCEDTASFVQSSKLICKMIPEDDIHFATFIAEKMIPVDLRHLGDHYYDCSWEKDILERRRMADNGNWYVMSEEDYYYTLVYHAILQKSKVNPQYIDELNVMAEKLGVCSGDKEIHLKNLDHYMNRRGYRYVQPDDGSVPFQWQYINHAQGRTSEKEVDIIRKRSIRNFMGVFKKLGCYSRLKEWQYRAIRNTYDERTGKFLDIDRFARKVREKYEENIYDQLAQRRVYNYIDRYRSEIENIRLHLPAKMILKRNRECDNAVFTMWMQGYEEMPKVVQACLKSMERLGRKIVFLTEENLEEYIYLPDYIWDKYRSGEVG